MRVIHLMASGFVGGPEHQVLNLATTLKVSVESVFISFAERGLAAALLNEARERGFDAVALRSNTPRLFAMVREVADHLSRLKPDLLCCHGYKPDVVGWMAGRRAGIPVVAVAHGWTGATQKVRWYETLDRWVLRKMDCTVCVSAAQADKVLCAGVAPERVCVIHNAIGPSDVTQPDPEARQRIRNAFAWSPRVIVGAAGRLSPEKGFDVLIDAAARARQADSGLGFILFGEGPMRDALQARIATHSLERHFILAGFQPDVRRLLPHLDVLAASSHTEGLPVILLEAGAASLPIVATSVGGVPEVVDDGVTGFLVPPGDAAALARRILDLAAAAPLRRAMGRHGRQRISERFSLEAQGARYHQLFRRLRDSSRAVGVRAVRFSNGEAAAAEIPSVTAKE